MDAAVRALVHNGCARLSVRRVVAKARASIVAVKHHFASKDGLLAATEHVTTRFRSHADELAQSALAEERPAVASLVSVYLANVGETPDEHAEAG